MERNITGIAMNENKKNNIILIGYMGCGKTTVGEALAGCLSYQFMDTDQLLEEKTSDTINHIFAVQGEEYFRNLETELLEELQPTLKQTVLSTGGGLPLREQNVKLLKEMGYIVYLKASKETTLQRLTGDRSRPLLQGENVEQKIENMLASRTPIYTQAADQSVITDDKSIEEIVTLIRDNCMRL